MHRHFEDIIFRQIKKIKAAITVFVGSLGLGLDLDEDESK